MTTTLILRLLDSAGGLLAWASVPAIARGDGCLRARDDLAELFVEREGTVAEYVWHWPDLHVQSRVPAGEGILVATTENSVPFVRDEILLELKSDVGPLPAVTVRRPVAVAVPTGTLSIPTGTVEVL
jgi:hypothetical protein